MSRTVQIALAPHLTDTVVNEIQSIDGVTGIRLQRGASLRPEGDLLTVDLTSTALMTVMQRLEAHGLGKSSDASITTSAVLSSISSPEIGALTRESIEATWEEMESSLLKESNTSSNTLLLMFCAGLMAAIGIAMDTLHVVLGAMLIAPGFEPITRIALGLVARSQAWRRGLADVVMLYLALMVGAGAATFLFLAMGRDPLAAGSTYLAQGSLTSYWTTLTPASIVVSAAASIAGGILVATNRSTLTAGVMIGLALIPAMTLAAMGLLLGDWDTAAMALLRWVVDVALVLTMSLLVLAWKRWRVQRRRMLL